MAPMRSASLLFLLLLVGQDDARILSTGELGARHDALNRILAIAPDQRTMEMWLAVKQETDRLVACLDVVPPSPMEKQTRRCDIVPQSEDNYLPDLITALAQTRDPAMISSLIRVAPSGAIATNGLVRFGESAVPALTQAATSSRSGPWGEESTGAMFALAKMLQQADSGGGVTLTPTIRLRITETARTLLETGLTSTNQIAIVALALATRDAALRSQVQDLATNTFEWPRRGVTDPAEIARIQNSIRFQLTGRPNP